MRQFSVGAVLFFVSLYFAVQFPAPAFGETTYYVAAAGSDGGPGSSAAPFRTIQRAADAVNAGDTVVVRDGVYSNAAASGTGSKMIIVSRGGTASSWITFRSENKWGAVIDGLNNTTAEAWAIGANYVRVQDFDVRGFSDDAFSNYPGGQFLEIVGNNIHDIGRYCTDTGIGRDGIFIGKSNVTVERNLIHDIGRFGPGENGCNPSTYTYQNNDHGIYIDGDFGGANNVMVRNNIFYNVKHGWSIHVYPSALSNLSILNNTFAFPNQWRTGHIILAAPVTNSRIENNIFYQPNTVAINFNNQSGFSNLNVGDNMIYPGTVGDASPSGVSYSANQENTNPLMVNPEGFDFRPASGSPAVNIGALEGGQPVSPSVNSGGIVSLANPGGPITPGAVVEVYGNNLAPQAPCASPATPWLYVPCSSPTRVVIGDRDAEVLYVSSGQINAQIPPDAGVGEVALAVISGDSQSNTVAITLAP